MRKLCLGFVVLLLTAQLRADVLTLKDGTRLEGQVQRGPDGWTITSADGKTRKVAPDSVKSIELGSGAKGAEQAAAGLASLRRSVEALSDINQIIERYERLIENTKDATVAADAKGDLDLWRGRREQGLVKHGNKWVMPEDVAALSAKVTAAALDARELIRQNRNKEAEQALAEAITEDPQNAVANYLRGVALYRLDKFVDARKCFETVNAAAPGHPPTLNNLAVILARQNAVAPSLNYYDQAMQASGVNKYILDNVAEALGSIPEDQRKGNLIARVLKRFAELDLILQQQMGQQGLYRWGGGWVNQKQLDEIKAAEKEVRDKLISLQQDFERADARINAISREISDNERTMADLRARSIYARREADGTISYVPVPLPQSYYDLQRANTQLRSEQDQLRTQMEQMQEQRRRIEQQTPVPKFTGIQQIVGVEGLPGPTDLPPPPGGTEPTTLPAGPLD